MARTEEGDCRGSMAAVLGHKFLGGASTAKTKKISLVAFDTEFETDGGKFICGAFYGELKDHHGRKQVISEYCSTLQEFQDTFRRLERQMGTKNRFTLIGYNSAVDIPYLGDIVDTNSRLDSGSRFITAQTKNGTKIIDCTNHVTGSLQSWMARLKMKETHGIGKRTGYLDSDEGKRSQVLDDARATWILACWIRDFYHSKGITLPITQSSAALKIFQKHYFTGAWYRFPGEQWKSDFERESYYGGRCEVFRRGLQEVQSFDVHSMYVSIMRDDLIPNPTVCKYLDSRQAMEQFKAGEFLTLDVTVRVPYRRVGLLPYREPETGKLLFPTGRWRATYSSVELQAAVEFGATIVEIHRALWYPESDYYFHDYAQMTLDGRAECKLSGDAAREQMYKLLGNGLYGKFGQRNAEGGNYVKLEEYDGDIEGKTIFWQDDGSAWVEVPKADQIDALHTFPVIPATIAAYARVKLLRALVANEDAVVYCDTDSIKTNGEVRGIEIGPEPGEFGFEYACEEEFYSPKCYGDHRKGVPKAGKEVARLYDDNGVWVGDAPGETWYIPVWTKYKTAIRSGKPQNVVKLRTKYLSLIDSKRAWDGDESMPIVVNGGLPTFSRTVEAEAPEALLHRTFIAAL